VEIARDRIEVRFHVVVVVAGAGSVTVWGALIAFLLWPFLILVILSGSDRIIGAQKWNSSCGPSRKESVKRRKVVVAFKLLSRIDFTI
jgi:hypothetical protein